MKFAVGDGALVHPRTEHRADRTPQLLVRVLRERLIGLAVHPLLVQPDDVLPILGVEIGVELVAVALLVGVEDLLEIVVRHVEHDVRVHVDEAAIRIESKAPVARNPRQGLHGLIVEAEVKHGVHHARHRGARAGAHRQEQRIVRIAELLAHHLADEVERLVDLRLQILRIGLVVLVEVSADLGGDGEAGRNREAEIGHFGEVGALAAEQILHLGGAFGLAAAERIDPLSLDRAGLGLRRRALGGRGGGDSDALRSGLRLHRLEGRLCGALGFGGGYFRGGLGLGFRCDLAADRPALALVTDRRLTVLVNFAIARRFGCNFYRMQAFTERARKGLPALQWIASLPSVIVVKA